MSLFSSLNTGVSGMSASKNALATTSHNISNANTEFYTRQRTTNSTNYSRTGPINTGYGVNVDNVVRLHDEFVYARLKLSANKLEYSSFSKKSLEEVSKYFPDLQKVGLKKDLSAYYNAWNNFSSNTSEGSQKINLITATNTLTANLQNTRSRVRTLQDSINMQLKVAIDEVNSLGKKIANINKEIVNIEALQPTVANDLRDQRDKLEFTLSKLLNIKVFKGDQRTNTAIHSNIAESGNNYNLNIAGFSFIHGVDFHPIVINSDKNPSSYYSVYGKREDDRLIEMTKSIQGGKIGAMLDLRGRTIDINSKGGYPQDGILQTYIDDLDTFAKTVAVQTNNIYAMVAQDDSKSSIMPRLEGDKFLMTHDRDIKKGSFDVIVYNAKGEQVAKKTIQVNETTSLDDTNLGNSIVADFNKNSDDNGDNDRTNDVDDYFQAKFSYSVNENNGYLNFERKDGKDGYKIAIVDHGTNFPGVMGMNRFFEGNSAQNIRISDGLQRNPDSLQGYTAPVDGNNEVANAMVQMQYKQFTFERANGTTSTESIEGFYRFVASNIATDAESASTMNDTNLALHKTVNTEYQTVSGVNLDEELADLMKFQTAYSSNAKVLTTIDKMLDALLAIR